MFAELLGTYGILLFTHFTKIMKNLKLLTRVPEPEPDRKIRSRREDQSKTCPGNLVMSIKDLFWEKNEGRRGRRRFKLAPFVSGVVVDTSYVMYGSFRCHSETQWARTSTLWQDSLQDCFVGFTESVKQSLPKTQVKHLFTLSKVP